MRLTLSLLLALSLTAAADPAFRDVIYRQHGGPLTGRVAGADGAQIRCEVMLIEGQPPAWISLPRTEIVRVAFAADERLDTYLRNAKPDKINQLAQMWKDRRFLLSLPESNSGQIGLALAEMNLSADQAEQALSLFKEIEISDWNSERRADARNGKLRALLKLGQVEKAVQEARQIENENADPKLLMEAKFILAEAGFHAFQKLLEENPRWQEDENILPERNRLYHETLDLYLFPFLFHGSEQAASARGLWRAVEMYRIGGDPKLAVEAAKDIATLYPASHEAAQAKEFLKHNPPSNLN